MRYVYILIILASVQLQANQSYFLTFEEAEAGFAIRDSDAKEEDKAALTDPSPNGASSAQATAQSLVTDAEAGGGIGTAVSIAAKARAAINPTISIMAAAAPAIAKIAIAAAVTVAMAPMVIKVAKGVLVAAVTGICYWLGLPLDCSVTAGAAAPIAVESAGGWLKNKLRLFN